MPKVAKELSAVEVRRLSKPGLHAVGGVNGLLHRITPTGARGWVLRIKVGGKRRDIGLGGYPDVTLAQARERARTIRDMVWEGRDPIAERQAQKDALKAEQARRLTFAEAARRCHAKKAQELRSAKQKKQWLSLVERHAFPKIGHLPVDEIEIGHVQSVLEPIWHTKTETARRIRQRIEAILTWATVSGYRSGDNPARWEGNLAEVMPHPTKIHKAKHFAALPWREMPAFLERLRAREGMGARALEFIIYTAARSGEVRHATWDEIDYDAAVWTVPGERMKGYKPHRVPLTSDAIRMLKALPRHGESNLIFWAAGGGPISDMTISAVTKRMGVDAVPHGMRSSFKDWARSCTSYPDEVSELALAHVNSDATRAAYARDELLPQRARLMRDWCRFLNEGLPEGEVIGIGEAAQ